MIVIISPSFVVGQKNNFGAISHSQSPWWLRPNMRYIISDSIQHGQVVTTTTATPFGWVLGPCPCVAKPLNQAIVLELTKLIQGSDSPSTEALLNQSMRGGSVLALVPDGQRQTANQLASHHVQPDYGLMPSSSSSLLVPILISTRI